MDPKMIKAMKIGGLIGAVLFVCGATVAGIVVGSRHPSHQEHSVQCGDRCTFSLAESIPLNLTLGPPYHISTYEAWKWLLNASTTSINIAAAYWTLRGVDTTFSDPSDWQGEKIFNMLKTKGLQVPIRIAESAGLFGPNNDSRLLSQAGLAQVRSVNFTRLLGNGILHTKFILVDDLHFYIGSANMDWRSLTQIHEMGVFVTNCPCLAADLRKVFEVYWTLGAPNAKVPKIWPANLATEHNASNPFQLKLNGTASKVYLGSSPPPLSPQNREQDINGLLKVIHDAKKFIHITVMDYAPALVFQWPQLYWDVIDTALRSAAFDRGIQVKVMGSKWNNRDKKEMVAYLKSLSVLNDALYRKRGSIETRMFVVPSFSPSQANIPYARVNHDKYMVTDNSAYIGTSNWSGDYFVDTAGVSFVVRQNSSNGSQPIITDLQNVFLRDWNSNFSHSIWEY